MDAAARKASPGSAQNNEESRPTSLPGARNKRAIFGALVLVLLLASLDQTIVSTALPAIVSEIGGLTHLSWIVTAYLLTTTVVVPLYGKLGDLFGRRIVLQLAIAIFLAGSALCGFAQTLPGLIAFRAIQGLGGGGLIVTAVAIVGDLVPPRERGRYQGFFGGVFGLSTVLGPLIGGFIVQHLSWRWIFFVNVPLGLLALAVIAATLTAKPRRTEVSIDYAGATLLALAVTGVVLATSLAGPLIAGAPAAFAAIAVVSLMALIGFLAVEVRARDPLLPLSLFANRTFAVAVAVGFIVGAALFGSVTLLPVYLQVVKGLDPASAGLHLTPMMLGVLVSSITSGQIISRIGRYRMFPIAGTALMTVALVLLSRLDVATAPLTASAYMLILGLGLGMVMQILVMAVQNSVAYEQLGVATSGTTLFRSIGGCVGTALFGGIFAYGLTSGLDRTLPGVAKTVTDPAAVAALAEPLRSAYLALFVAALHPVFETAAALALAAFLLSFALKEVPLRATIAPEPLSETFEMPREATSLAELERIVTRMIAKENRWRVYQRAAAETGIDLEPDALWLLARLAERSHPVPEDELARRLGLGETQCQAWIARLRAAGMAERDADGALVTTPEGRAAYDRLVARREANLDVMLRDWNRSEHPDVRAMMGRLARSFASAPPERPPVARPSVRDAGT